MPVPEGMILYGLKQKVSVRHILVEGFDAKGRHPTANRNLFIHITAVLNIVY
jgi:hypothetical protein